MTALMKMDGFDDCIIGISECFDQESRIVYDLTKVLSKLESMGMTAEEAQEYYEYNQLGAFVPGCPIFVNCNWENTDIIELT